MQSDRNTAAPPPRNLVLRTDGPAGTHRIGDVIAEVLGPGDTICVAGALGAGKSELCRAIIRRMLQNAELEVPSPSYTLVNVYDHADCEIWHADLYRIGDESELEEIGLEDATADSVVLVEWPERWAQPPVRRLEITLQSVANEIREFGIQPVGHGWDTMMNRLRLLA